MKGFQILTRFVERRVRVGTSLKRCVICLCLSAVLTGCAQRNRTGLNHAPVLAPASYLDLQSGWRLEVIVPLSKHGFTGYQKQIYEVGKHRSGVKIRLESASAAGDGIHFAQQQPVVELFRLPPFVKRVRLIFLQRVSTADHNMAVLGATRLEQLDLLTSEVENNPQSCVPSDEMYCSWIPVGIAVRAERYDKTQGIWLPAE